MSWPSILVHFLIFFIVAPLRLASSQFKTIASSTQSVIVSRTSFNGSEYVLAYCDSTKVTATTLDEYGNETISKRQTTVNNEVQLDLSSSIHLLKPSNNYIISSSSKSYIFGLEEVIDFPGNSKLQKQSIVEFSNLDNSFILSSYSDNTIILNQYNNQGVWSESLNWTSTVGILVCLSIDENTILCFCEEENKFSSKLINKNNLTLTLTQTIDPLQNSSNVNTNTGAKVVLLNTTTILVCVLKKETYSWSNHNLLYCTVYGYDPSTKNNVFLNQKSPISNTNRYAVLVDTSDDINKMSIIRYNDTMFLCAGIQNDQSVIYSQIQYIDNGDFQVVKYQNTEKIQISLGLDIITFDWLLLNEQTGFLFTSGSKAYLTVLFSNTCNDIIISSPIYYPSNENEIDQIGSYIGNGYTNFNSPELKLGNDVLEIYFASVPSGFTVNNENASIELNQPYNVSSVFTFNVNPSVEPGVNIVVYYPTNSWLRCNILITVEQCYKGCKTCSAKGVDEKDMKCLTCDSDSNYYGYAQDHPIHQLENYNQLCHQNAKDYFYLDTDVFKPCDVGCKTCEKPTWVDMKCTQCDNDYYPYHETTGNTFQCYNSTTKPEDLFLDSDSVYKKCHSSCLNCSEAASDSSTNCDQCNTSSDYYPLESDQSSPKNCIPKTTSGYYLDNNIMKPCDISCSECNTQSNLCTSCNQNDSNLLLNYYFKENNTSLPKECYIGSTVIDYYYLNQNTKFFEKCFKSCWTCSELGGWNNNKCLSCDKQNYYPVEGLPNECWNEQSEDKNANFHLDGDIYKVECGNGCAACVTDASTGFPYCSECDNDQDYYEIRLSPGSCRHIDWTPDGTYWDKNSWKFEQCYSLCSKCTDQGTPINNKCTACVAGYTLLDFITNEVMEEGYNCAASCLSNQYFYLDEYGTYRCTTGNKCPTERPIKEETRKQCVESCKPNAGTCIECKDPNKSWYEVNNECVEECPPWTIPVLADGACIDDDICKYEKYLSDEPWDNLANFIDIQGLNYSRLYQNLDKQVVIIQSSLNEYKTIIFEEELCAYNWTEDWSQLNLADCPRLLRDHYNIPSTENLIILKTDVIHTNQIGYAFYRKTTGERLNMEICNQVKITVSIPFSNIDDDEIDLDVAKQWSEIGVDVYDIEDPFFNDICFPFTSEDGEDVSLQERRDNYYQNVSFCEPGCKYTNIDFDTELVDCECEVQQSFWEQAFDNEITGELFELLSSANVQIFQCYKNVFSLDSWNNLGNYTVWILISVQIACTVFYFVQKLTPIWTYWFQFSNPQPNVLANPPIKWGVNDDDNTKPQEIAENKANTNWNNNENKDANCVDNDWNAYQVVSGKETKNNCLRMIDFNDWDDDNNVNKSKDDDNNNNNDNDKEHSNKENSRSINNNTNNQIYLTNKISIKTWDRGTYLTNNVTENSENVVGYNGKFANSENNYSEQKLITNNWKTNHNWTGDNQEKEMIKKTDEEDEDFDYEFDDDELNEMCVDDAVKYDKRTFWPFFWENLKENQQIISTFFTKDPLDSLALRSTLFIFGLTLYLFINALFYTESSLCNVFLGIESFDFFTVLQNEIGRLIYSTIVSIFLGILSDFMLKYKKRLEAWIEKQMDGQKFLEKSNEIIQSMNKTNIIFFVVNYLSMLLFWYYIWAFCNVYYNSRINWFLGSIITYLIINLFMALLALIISGSRFLGLRFKVWRICYVFSQWLM